MRGDSSSDASQVVVCSIGGSYKVVVVVWAGGREQEVVSKCARCDVDAVHGEHPWTHY